MALFYPDGAPGPRQVRFVLFDVHGQVLDHVAVEGEPGSAWVHAQFQDGRSGSLASLTVHAPGSGGIRLERMGQEEGRRTPVHGDSLEKAAFRITIAGDRIVIDPQF